MDGNRPRVAPCSPMADPVDKAAVSLAEIGVSGLRVQSGRVVEEQLRQLQGQRAMTTYTEMRSNDAVVASTLLAYEMWVREATWRTEPASTDPAAVEAADFIDGAVNDMSGAWEDYVAEAMAMLQYGYAYAELVYKKRNGHVRRTTPNAPPSSDFDDGRYGWRKVAYRAQESIERWEFDDTGGLAGAWQRIPDAFELRYIMIEKAVLMRTSRHKGNPEGRALLRPAFVPWFYRKRMRELEAIGVERDLAGFPVLYVDREILANEARLNEYKQIARDIKRDEQEGLVLPAAFDDHGNRRVELQLLTSGGARQYDVGAIMTRYALEIVMAMLADVLMLGHEKVGSFALAQTKMDLVETAGETWLGEIAQVFNSHAIPRLLELNGMDPALAPKRVPGQLRSVDLAERATAIKELALAGFLTPDDGVEDTIRDEFGLPARDVEPVGTNDGEDDDADAEADEEARAATAAAAQAAETAKRNGRNGTAGTRSDVALAMAGMERWLS